MSKKKNKKDPQEATPKGLACIPSELGFQLLQDGYDGQEPVDTVIQAIVTYLETGTAKATQELTGTSYGQLAAWKAASWYPKLVERLREESQAKFDAKLSKSIDRSLEVIEDRLENGDYVFTKAGLQQVPVSASVATKILGTLHDRRQLVRGEATKIVREEKSGLQQLQEMLKKIAQEKQPEKVIPGESVRIS